MKKYPTSLFSQVLDLVPRAQFARIVRDHEGEKHAKGFTCWKQFVAMMFYQLAGADSLREIEYGLESCLGKLNHLGIDAAPKRSTLAYANKHRPCKIYEDTFNMLVGKCMGEVQGKGKKGKLRNLRKRLFSFDATMIDLCASMYDWAHYQQAKGAVKINLLLSHQGFLPAFADITNGKVHEVSAARKLKLQPGSIVAMDRGLIDYSLFHEWDQQDITFVTRTKTSMVYEEVAWRGAREHIGILEDNIIKLTGPGAEQKCPIPLRVVIYKDRKSGKIYEYLTNNLVLSARTIADIYEERWQIETFFRDLKQNLQIRTFVGTSANAVKIQIWTALISMLLIQYLRLKSGCTVCLSNLIKLLSWNLFTYRDLWPWVADPIRTPPARPDPHPTFGFLDSVEVKN